jgi:hypothetical protein
MPMILSALALAAAAPPPSPSPPSREQVIIGSDNVDLAGAGDLQFYPESDPVLAAMGVTTFGPGDSELGTARITFNHQGRAVACVPGESAETGSTARGVAALCEQIKAKGEFRRNFGFDLPYDTGQLAVAFWGRTLLTPLDPIAILPAGKGYDVTMVMIDGRCQIEGNPFSEWEETEICAAWTRAGRPGFAPLPSAAAVPPSAPVRPNVRSSAPRKSAGRPVRAAARPARPAATPARVQIAYIAIRLGPNRSEITVGQRLIWRDVDIVYPQVPFDERPPIGTGNGSLESKVSENDYPSLALREEIEGKVKILVGFRRDGEPASCRPIGSSGTAYLDNMTCKVAMRRLHFAFSGRISDFSGLRYETKDFRWVIPEE